MLKSTRDGLLVGQRWPRVGSRCNRYPLHTTAIGRRLQNWEAAGVTARISPREKYSHRNISASENIPFLGETYPKPNPNPNPNPDPNPNRSRKKFLDVGRSIFSSQSIPRNIFPGEGFPAGRFIPGMLKLLHRYDNRQKMIAVCAAELGAGFARIFRHNRCTLKGELSGSSEGSQL